MNRPSLESIFSALFAAGSGASGIVSSSRRLKAAKDVQPEESPALYQVEGEFSAKYIQGMPTRWELKGAWIIAVAQPDTTVAPSIALNNALDSVLQTLASAGTNTLGGLVTSVAVDGKVDVFEGSMTSTSVAFIPITIIVAGF